MSKILGIITARGGSKGIPGKNIKPLLGKPLIAYTIEAAHHSGVFSSGLARAGEAEGSASGGDSRLILSTDDEKISAVAKEYGCEVPFMRPKELAEDNTKHLPVIRHAVKWLADNENYHADYVMVLQPTSPLRQAFHIKEAVDLILKTRADSVLSVAGIPENFSPHKAMKIDDGGFLKTLSGDSLEKRISRRQDLPKTYWSVGSIYLFRTDLILDPEKLNFYGDKTVPYIIDDKYSVDINEPADWEKAEGALKLLI